MSGGWANSDRKSRLPADWDARRKAVLTAADGRCAMPNCRRRPTDVDHIVAGDDHSQLQALCRHHHRKKSSAEGNAARAERAATTQRQAEQPTGRRRRE